jgi:hypothetical protein
LYRCKTALTAFRVGHKETHYNWRDCYVEAWNAPACAMFTIPWLNELQAAVDIGYDAFEFNCTPFLFKLLN